MSDLINQYIIAQEEHDYNKKYEEGTIVKHTIDNVVTAYTAKKNVPQFISILNENYWKKIASTKEGGTADYDNLKNKPSINGVELEGNITTKDLGIDNKFKGWHASSSSLPVNPVVGDYAYVKGATATDPAAIYECTTAGTWSDSGRTADTSNVQTFASGEEVNEVHIVNDLTTGGTKDVLSAEQGKILNTYVNEQTQYPSSDFSYRNKRLMDESGNIYDTGSTSNDYIYYLLNSVALKKGSVLQIKMVNIAAGSNNYDIRIAMFDKSVNLVETSVNAIPNTFESFSVPQNTTTILTYVCPTDGQIAIAGKRLGQVAYWSDISMDCSLTITVKEKLSDIDSHFSSKITALNSDAEFTPKFLSAKKRYYTSSITNVPNPLVIAHITDIHGDFTNVQRFIDFTNKYASYIDETINTGDLVSAYYTDGINGYGAIDGAEKILNIIGNHDTRGSEGWRQYVGVNVYNQQIKPFIENWGVTQPTDAESNGYCYYYKDYPSQSIRLICIDIMGYDLTQNTWLNSILTDARLNNLSVVIAVHFAGASSTIGNPPFTKVGCNYSTIYELATNSNQLYSYNADGYLLASTVNDFISDGGEFIGYITGHFHTEVYAKQYDYPNQLIFGAESAKGGVERRDYNHISGTRFQDGFNILSIDTYLKTVKIYKVGANIDLYGRRKDCITINYLDGSIITDK